MSDAAEDDMPPRRDEVELFLSRPVEYQGKTHASVNLREPSVAEWVDAQSEPGLRATAKLMFLVSGVPFPATLKFPVSTVAEADLFFTGFMLPARKTPAN